MKKLFRKVLSAFAAAAVIFTVLPATSLASFAENVDSFPDPEATFSSQSTVTLTYDDDGGFMGSVPEPMEYNVGDEVTVQFEEHPFRAGAGFIGWARTDGATEAEFYEEGTTTFIINEDTTLYAVWQMVLPPPTDKTLTYYDEGDTGSVPEPAVYDYDSEVTVQFDEYPGRDGARFVGWARDENADEAEFTADGTTTFNITEDTTLYAIWEPLLPPAALTVTYDDDGDTGSVPEPATYAYGDEVVVQFDEYPGRDGATFKGWARDENADEAEFTADGTTTFDITESTILYAVWEALLPPPVAMITGTASAGANGTISNVGEDAYLIGDEVTFTITPAEGYKVKDVLFNNVSVGAVTTYKFVVENAFTISATFEADTKGVPDTGAADGTAVLVLALAGALAVFTAARKRK